MGRSIKKNSTLLFVISLVVSILASMVLGIWYFYQKVTVIPYYQKHLLNIAKKRVKAVNAHLEKQEKNLQSLAHEKKVIAFFKDQSTEQDLRSFITSSEHATAFENSILIKPDGTVIFANKNQKKFMINVTQPLYKHMSLSQSFDRAIKTMTPDVASFSFDMLLKTPTLYVSVPVFNEQKTFMGIIAVQINMNGIYAITNNYFELGNTGDVILAKAVKHGAQIIAPTRNYPDSAFEIIEFRENNTITPIEHAMKGQDGAAVTVDFKGDKVIGAWSYITPLAWGIAVTMRYTEASQAIHYAYTWWYFSFLFALAIIVLMSIWERRRIIAWIQNNIISNTTNIFLIGMALLFMLLTALLLYRYHHLTNVTVRQAHQQTEQKITSTIQLLQKELQNIMQRASAIAQDLTQHRLHTEDLDIRMKRDIKENPYLYGIIIAYGPHQYDKEHRLYAPHYVRFKGDYKREQLEDRADYTKKSTITTPSAAWYTTALKGATWLSPVKEHLTGKMVARYAVPFYKKEDEQNPIGIVVAEFNLDSFASFAQKIAVGATGYSFIIDTNGTFVYHPTAPLVTQQKTVFEHAQEHINKPLYDIGSAIIKGGRGRSSYQDQKTSETTWIHYAPIPQTPWSIALVFTQEEISISSIIVRHAFMGIITAIVLALLFLLLFLCQMLIAPKRRLQVIALSYGIVLLLGLAGLWYLIHKTISKPARTSDEVIIRNQIMLTAYLEERQREARTRYQTITTIPTGIFINTLAFDNIRSITFSGYIWQQYDKASPIERQITLPGATKITLEKTHEEVTNAQEIIGWKITATLPTLLDYSQYPFDQQRIIIPFTHPNAKVVVLPIPDFEGYGATKFVKHIGLSRAFSLSEFFVDDAYFNYKPVEQPELISNQAGNRSVGLHYTLLLTRNTLNAFIIYFIPLFVILFSLFATVNFTKVTDSITSTAIIPYTAPLFALIILHGNLRNAYTFGNILYIEYLFFLTYLTIIGAISFDILISWKRGKPTQLSPLSNLIKLLFWPTQFALWYCATIIAFY